MKVGKIKKGWEHAGRELVILGKPIIIHGMSWTP